MERGAGGGELKAMLTRNERIIVEAIRNAPVVEIVIPGYDGVTGVTRIKVASKRVCHDVAIAVQSHLNSANRGGGRSESDAPHRR